MKINFRLLAACAVLALAGCISFSSGEYPSAIDEGFVECEGVGSLDDAVASGGNFVARFEFLPGDGAASGAMLPALSDNVGRQIWGKDANFAGNGSYVRKAGMWNFEEVRVVDGELEVMLNGYVVTRAKKGEFIPGVTRWVGYAGNEQVRNLRIRRLPLS